MFKLYSITGWLLLEGEYINHIIENGELLIEFISSRSGEYKLMVLNSNLVDLDLLIKSINNAKNITR